MHAWPYYPFAEPFFELNTTDVVESAGSAVVAVELRGTEITFDIAVTLATATAATAAFPATGNILGHVSQIPISQHVITIPLL